MADIQVHREAAEISTNIMRQIVDAVQPGISVKKLDDLAVELCNQYQVEPAFHGVGERNNPFPGNICVSINDETLHTIPTADSVVKDGDLVKVDFGIIYKGYYTDHCVTVVVGDISEREQQLWSVTKFAVEQAALAAHPGATTGDLGHKMYSIVSLAGFDVLKDYVGHGIGKNLHLSPEIPAYGNPGMGDELKTGQVICVEAQVVMGTDKTLIDKDGWTIRTADGEKSAMFEYMVYVGKDGPEILTDTRNWDLHVKS